MREHRGSLFRGERKKNVAKAKAHHSHTTGGVEGIKVLGIVSEMCAWKTIGQRASAEMTHWRRRFERGRHTKKTLLLMLVLHEMRGSVLN